MLIIKNAKVFGFYIKILTSKSVPVMETIKYSIILIYVILNGKWHPVAIIKLELPHKHALVLVEHMRWIDR